MICNKKAYTDLRKECEVCSERDACFSGHAVGVALMRPIPQFQVGGVISGNMGLFVDVNNSAELIPNTEVRRITENIISAMSEVMKNVKEDNYRFIRQGSPDRH